VLTLCALVPPYISGYLIDAVVEPVQDGRLALERALFIGWIGIAGMGVVYVLRQLCNWVRLRLMTVLGEYVARDLRTELYEHLQGLSLSFFARKLLCWTIALHGRRMNELFLRAWRKWSSLTDLLSDTIPGMRVVKAFHQEEREKRRFGHRNHDVVAEFNRIHGVWTSFWPGLLLAIHALVLVVWLLALPRLLGPDSALGPGLSAGTFVAFLLYMTMFVHPIEVIGQMARVMNRATSSPALPRRSPTLSGSYGKGWMARAFS
jgi:ABC-type multidrug transport system fused ATPase/permease subunit